MNSRIKRYFNIAKEISYTSDFKRIKIGAILIDRKDIISASSNLKKSHPLQKKLNPLRFEDCIDGLCHDYLHAEMNCLLKIPYNIKLKDPILVVYREDRKHNLANCRPCNACMAKIKELNIHHICYTTENGYCEEELNYEY